jgi:hypothetical protein
MALSDPRRRQLVESLRELRQDRPIDNPQIERVLAVLLEALLDDDGDRTLASGDSGTLLRGVDLGR